MQLFSQLAFVRPRSNMLAILTLLFLFSLSDTIEQRSMRKPKQEPEIYLLPCTSCSHASATLRIRTYRSIYFNEIKKKIEEENYQENLRPKEHVVPISHEKIVLGDPRTVLKME